MLIKEIMNKKVKTINHEKSLQEAAALMSQLNCGSIPVEDEDRLIGMITDRDITVRAVSIGKNPNQEKVKSYMTKGIRYCYESDDLDRAGKIMRDNQMMRLPVLNTNKQLVGIVTLGDIARKSPDEHLVYQTMHQARA